MAQGRKATILPRPRTHTNIDSAGKWLHPLSPPSPVHATNCSYQTLVLLHFVACLKIQSAKCRANKQNQTKQMKIQVATCKANKTQQQQQRMRHILPAEEGGRRRRGEGDGTKHGMAHSNPKQNFLFSHTRWPKSKKYSRQILLYEYPQAHERTQRGVQRVERGVKSCLQSGGNPRK